jgi:hypothetical protein
LKLFPTHTITTELFMGNIYFCKCSSLPRVIFSIYITCNNSKYGIVHMKSTKKRNRQSLNVERHTCNMQVITDCHYGLICISAVSKTDHSWNPFLPSCTNATTLSTRTKTQICKSKSSLPFSLHHPSHTPHKTLNL